MNTLLYLLGTEVFSAMIRKTYIWKEMPFIRLLPPFLAGIMTGEKYPSDFRIIFICLISVFLILFVFEYLSSPVAWKYRFYRGLLINMFLFGFGMIAVEVHSGKTRKDLIKLQIKDPDIKILRLLEPPAEKNGRWVSTAEISFVKDNHELYTSCNTLVYLPNETDTSVLQYGSRILTTSPLQEIKNNGNPGSFDFKDWYADQSVFFRVYLKPGNIFILENRSANPLFSLVYQIRNRILYVLEENIRDSAALGLAQALLIGYRNNLDRSLLKVYANTGVVHVIAISGLHLGLIYALMMLITDKLIRNRNRRIIQLFLVIPSLWIFSLATGASASVIRSAVMFTLLCLGNFLGKKSHSMNALASSAFLLLCFFPSWISDTGFLLSYSAVSGILLYQRRIADSYFFKNPAARKFWESISLTLAAQILTTPLILYLFHRFPLLFLFSNLVAVPLSSLILIMELVLCGAELSGIPPEYIGWIIENLIRFLNDYVLKMDAVPYTVLHTRNISLLQVALMYEFIFFISCGLIYKSKNMAFAGLISIALFQGINLFRIARAEKQLQVVVLNVNRSQSLAIIRGRSMKLFTGAVSSTPIPAFKELLDPVTDHFYVNSIDFAGPVQKPTHLSIRNNSLSVLVLTGKKDMMNLNTYSETAPPGMVVLSGNPSVSISGLFRRIPCRYWVADASNNLWKIQKWKKEAEELHLRFHSVPEQGAFLLKKD